MADVLEGSGFWLPAEFFADDDFVEDQQHLANLTDPSSDFCFPTDFPYDLQTGNNCHLQKDWLMSTSPQSTLGNWSARRAGESGLGSPNPPTLGAKNDAVVDLIRKAAGQVAKLKMNASDGLRPTRNVAHVRPPLSRVNSSTRAPCPSALQHTRFMSKQQNQECRMWYSPQQQLYDFRSGSGLGKMEQAAWAIKQNPTRDIGSGTPEFHLSGSGSGVTVAKRECAGTGVFLPRVYGSATDNSCNAHSSESHRKPVYPTLLQERNVDPLFEDFDEMKAALVRSLSQTQPKPHINGGFICDYDLLMARRKSIMLQYQRSLLSEKWPMGRENYLPRQWHY